MTERDAQKGTSTMRIFITGATGFIGMKLTQRLCAAGYEVSGLARNDKAASLLEQLGSKAVRGELADQEVLQGAARAADAVIHLGFVYDFANLQNSVDLDFQAIRSMLAVMAGTGKTFVGTNGTLAIEASTGSIATEDTPLADASIVRGPAETLVRSAQGVRGIVVSLAPTVHGRGDHSFIPELITLAKQNGTSLYPGDGRNCWQAIYRDDAADLFRLVVEKGKAGRRYHGVAESALPMKDIATKIGMGLGLRAESVALDDADVRMGWMGHIASLGGPVSSQITREELGWTPSGPTLYHDLIESYFNVDAAALSVNKK